MFPKQSINEPKVKVFLCFCIAVCSLPITFLAVILGWRFVDHLRGRYEVSQFIKEHEDFASTQRAHPTVHEFSFAKSPNHSGTLLITMDVDDLTAYDKVQTELRQLDDFYDFTFLPETDFTIRSNEDPGMDLRAPAHTFARIGVAKTRVTVASLCAFVIFALLIWWLAIRPILRGKVHYFRPRDDAT